MHTTKRMIFHASTYIVRLQVLICCVNTCMQRYINRFSLIRTNSSVASDLRNLLRDKQERLTM